MVRQLLKGAALVGMFVVGGVALANKDAKKDDHKAAAAECKKGDVECEKKHKEAHAAEAGKTEAPKQ